MGTKDARVDAYIARSAEFARPILEHLRALVHEACPEVQETMKWSFPHFMYDGMLCSMAAFKQHCAFNFWKGALIFDGERDREAMGQFGRISKLADLPPKKVLAGYVKKAMALNDEGATVPKVRKPGLERSTVPDAPPADLAALLKKHAKARATFDRFPPSHRREYIQWITEAKRPETREKRLAQTIEWLAEGKSRNWKYESR
ncbi:MAG: hypothetical protein HOQ11_14090 [Gemmatimonadaceae bacterium]|nr:hypothetical protein [Gemmatimonadaceae bacterium]NUQ92996.1 hypothetical protein [Gemmatimonadaceae bacterium]NUR18872.1 hypothetical protein [Gemmatimonadaceae bacterium]NUS98531.1 hypothetical protein [Gemmatimonadaceae bacterium]